MKKLVTGFVILMTTVISSSSQACGDNCSDEAQRFYEVEQVWQNASPTPSGAFLGVWKKVEIVANNKGDFAAIPVSPDHVTLIEVAPTSVLDVVTQKPVISANRINQLQSYNKVTNLGRLSFTNKSFCYGVSTPSYATQTECRLNGKHMICRRSGYVPASYVGDSAGMVTLADVYQKTN